MLIGSGTAQFPYALFRELQDTRGQLEECKREKESLTIENSMLVEELADLKKEAIRQKSCSNPIRTRTTRFVLALMIFYMLM